MRRAARAATVALAVAVLLAMRLPAQALPALAAAACALVAVSAVALGGRFARSGWLAIPAAVALAVVPGSPSAWLAGLPWQVGAALAALAVFAALDPAPPPPTAGPGHASRFPRPWAWAATLLALCLPLVGAGILLAVLPGHLGSAVEVRGGGAALIVVAAVAAVCAAVALARLALAMRRALPSSGAAMEVEDS